jgi:hypothetical protein
VVRRYEKGDREKEWNKKGCASAAGRLTLHITTVPAHITTVLTCVYLLDSGRIYIRIDPAIDFNTVF